MITIENWNKITYEKYLEILSERESYYIFLDDLCEEIMPKLKNIFKGILKVKLQERDVENSYSSYCKDLCLDLVQEALLAEPEELFTEGGNFLSLNALADKVLILSEREDLNSYKNISEQESSEKDEKDPEARFNKRDKSKLWEETAGQECNEEENGDLDSELEEKPDAHPLTRDQVLGLLRPGPVEKEKEGLTNEQVGSIFNERKALFEKAENYLKAASKYIQNYILKLDLRSQKRFMTAYLYSKYRQDWEVSQKPCQRKGNAKGEQIQEINSHLVSVKQKQIQLANHYQQFGFWDEIIEPLFRHELTYNGFDRLNALFEKYRVSFSKNVGRDWKKEYTSLIEELRKQKDFKTKLSKKDINSVIRQLEYEVNVQPFFTSATKLKRSQKTDQLYDRDANMGNLEEVSCCQKYQNAISLLTRQEVLYKNDILPNETEFQAYRKHRKTCKNCLQYEKQMRARWIWRFSRMEENRQKSMQYFYPEHIQGTTEFDMDRVRLYYKALYNDKPSDLYQAYLEILSAREGKSFKPTAKNKKGRQNRGSKLGYSLETRCMCGAVNRYTLNALRFPLVTVGRQQEDGVPVAHINLCADDQDKLSTHQFYFKYDTAQGDWVIGIGSGDPQNPEDPKKSKALAMRVMYMKPQDLFDKLDEIKTVGGDAVKCQKLLENSWQPMEANKQVPLSQIALICVVSNKGFTFKGKKSEGIYHPIFGLLKNVAWLIEINANRADQSIIASVVEKSVLAD